MKYKFAMMGCLVTLGITACGSQPLPNTPTLIANTSLPPTPSATLVLTETPTQEPSPTSFPWPQEILSEDNISDLALIAEWGKGSIKGLSAVGNGDVFYAETLTKLIFFDTETLELLFELPKPSEFIFSPKYQFLVGVDSSGTINLGSLSANTSYSLETNVITENYTFSFSPTEDLLAVARYPNGDVRPEFHIINVYDTSSGELVATLDQGDYSPIPETIIISPDSQYLIVQEYGYRKRLGIWDISNERMVARFLDRTELPRQPFSPNSDIFATYSENFVFFWELSTGQAVGEYGTGLGYTFDLQFSENGDYISLNRGTQVRRVSDGRLLTSAEAGSVNFPDPPQTERISTNLSSQREWLESEGYFGDRGTIRLLTNGGFEIWMPGIDVIWNPTQETIRSIAELDYPGTQIHFYDDEILMFSCEEGQAAMFSSIEQINKQFGTCISGTLTAISFSSGMIALANETIIEVYNWSSGELVSTLRAHQSKVSSLTFSENGSLLASYGSDELFIWELEGDASRSQTLSGTTFVLDPFTFSPRNDYLIANQSGGSLGVWRLSDGQKLRDLRSPENVRYVSFIDDSLLVAGGIAGTIYFWDYVDTRLIHFIPTGLGRLSDLQVFMNSQGIIAASDDGIVRFWGLER